VKKWTQLDYQYVGDPMKALFDRIENLWVGSRIFRSLSASILCIVGFIYSLEQGFLMDESWFLAIIERVVEGEILYRDVFWPVTPLSVNIAVPLASVFGLEVFVLRAILTIYFVLTVRMCWLIGRQLRIGTAQLVVMTIGLVAYAPPGEVYGSHYNPLAVLFFLITLSATLRWEEVRSFSQSKAFRMLLIASISAALCVSAKPNLGVLALAGIFVSSFLKSVPNASSHNPLITLGWVSSIFVSTAVLLMAPTIIESGIGPFGVNIMSQRSYVSLGEIPYAVGLGKLFYPDAFSVRSLGALLPFLFLPVSVLGISLLFCYKRESTNNEVLILMAFLSLIVLGIWPRFDDTHLYMIVPLVLIVVSYTWFHLKPFIRPRFKRFTLICVFIWIGIWLRFTLQDQMAFAFSGNFQFSNLPHHRGVIVLSTWHQNQLDWAGKINEIVPSKEPILYVSRYAGFYYLISSRKNPSAHDSGLSNIMTLQIQEGLIDDIETEHIRYIYLEDEAPDYSLADPLRPSELESYIRNKMTKISDVMPIYTRP
jgi:hypothetical protein